jgi:hypothetical protein
MMTTERLLQPAKAHFFESLREGLAFTGDDVASSAAVRFRLPVISVLLVMLIREGGDVDVEEEEELLEEEGA